MFVAFVMRPKSSPCPAASVVKELQPSIAFVKFRPFETSIKPKLTIFVQPLHVLRNNVPLDISRAGNDVKPVQFAHVVEKSAPLERSSGGNEVKPMTSPQVLVKFVPLDVSSKGNDVNPVSRQVCAKLVTDEVSSKGNNVSNAQSRQPFIKFAVAELSTVAIDVKFAQP